jgi:hypothetical protein
VTDADEPRSKGEDPAPQEQEEEESQEADPVDDPTKGIDTTRAVGDLGDEADRSA